MRAKVQATGRALLKLRARQANDAGCSADKWGRFFFITVVLVWAASLVIGFTTSLIILTLFGFAAAIIGLRSPVAGLLGIGILCALDTLTRVYLLSGGLLRWNTLNYWLVVVVALNFLFLLRLNDPESRLMVAFLVILGVGLLVSPSKSEGIQDILNIVTVFGILIYFAKSLIDHKVFYWLGIVTGGLGAAGGFVFFLQKDSLAYINPNSWTYFPLTALLAICLVIPSAVEQQRGKFNLLTLAGINFIWIFLTGSRGGMLSALVCLIYLIIATRSFSWSTFLLIIVTLSGFWFTTRFSEQQVYALGRVIRFFDTSYSIDERTSGRSDIAEIGLSLFLENPLGVGTGGFQTEANIYGTNYQAHSAWVKVLAENGIPGIILLLAYMGSFAVVGWRTNQHDLFLIGLLVMFSFGVAFLSKEFQGKSLWLLAAGGTALLHKDQILEHLEEKPRNRSNRKYNHLEWRKPSSRNSKSDQFSRRLRRIGRKYDL